MVGAEAFAAGGADTRAAAAVSAVRSGTVVYFEGAVTVDGRPAELGMTVGPKAQVTTGPASYCDLVFADKNAVRVSQNGSAVLDFSGSLVEVTLEKGGVTSVLRKLSAAAGDDSFRIRTKAAVAGVRGTSFCVWSDGTVSYICACNGTIRTIDALGSNELVLSATHHSARLYAPEGRIIAVREAGMEHHTDESVESLAARIGERIDWTVLN